MHTRPDDTAPDIKNSTSTKEVLSANSSQHSSADKQLGTSGDQQTWHALPDAAAVLELLGTSTLGLSSKEAADRLARNGPNRLTPADKAGFWTKLWAQLNNILIFILLASAIVVGALQEWAEFGLILGVVAVNAGIGLYQEGKAEKAAEALKAMLSSNANVVRDGNQATIPAEQLVVGDVVLLKSGDKVPADVRLVECTNLQIQEAMLTGESVPVSKNLLPVAPVSSLGDRKCMAYSATLVTSGKAMCVVVATGDDAEIGKINSMVNTVDNVQTNLTLQLQILGRWIAFLVAIIALIAFLLALLVEKVNFKDAFESAVAIAVAIIPEGLPALVTIVLAIGTTVMANNHAIIRQLPCVETLGSLTVICSDKTGTLTKNEMTVVAVRTADAAFKATGVGYNPYDGTFTSAAGNSLSPAEAAALVAALEGAALCNDSALSAKAVAAPAPVSLVRKSLSAISNGISGGGSRRFRDTAAPSAFNPKGGAASPLHRQSSAALSDVYIASEAAASADQVPITVHGQRSATPQSFQRISNQSTGPPLIHRVSLGARSASSFASRTLSGRPAALGRILSARLFGSKKSEAPKMEYTPVGAPTEVALLTAAQKAGLDLGTLKLSRPRVASVPFESEHKFMATIHKVVAGRDAHAGFEGSGRGGGRYLDMKHGDGSSNRSGSVFLNHSRNQTGHTHHFDDGRPEGHVTIIVEDGDATPTINPDHLMHATGAPATAIGKVSTTSHISNLSQINSNTTTSAAAPAAAAATAATAGGLVMYVKGAPDRLLPLCSAQVVGAGRATGQIDTTFWQEEQARLSSAGLRVLAVCRAELPPDEDLSTFTAASLLQRPPFLAMVAMIAILDPPRQEAIEAVKVAHSAGIQVKMITGDHALTAAAIGNMLGIGGSHHLTGPQVDKMSDEELQAEVLGCNVFARSSPENKLRIVRALQVKRQIVAMTGDGVNDAPALKAADVGIAMGITGTDVSKEAAKMVLADDNFASIVFAVREGRRVWDNLRKILVFNLPVSFAQGTCILWAYILALDATPLTAIQVLYLNLVTAVTVGVMLAAEPAEPTVMDRPPRRRTKRIVGKLIIWRTFFVSTILVSLMIGMFYWGKKLGYTLEERRAEAFNTLAFGEIIYSITCRFLKASSFHPRVFRGNRWCWWAAGVAAGLQIFLTYCPGVNNFFSMTGMDGLQWLRVFVCMIVTYAVVEIEKALVDPVLMPVIKPVLNWFQDHTPRWLQTDAANEKVLERQAAMELAQQRKIDGSPSNGVAQV